MFYSKLTFRRRLGLRFNTSPRLSVTMAVLCVTYLLTPILSTPTVGQDKPAKRKPHAPPDPKPIELRTKDQVALTGTYFAGTKGENTVPIILIHGWEGVGGEFKPLAKYLQSLGHAVVVPDLRGHGESVQRRTADGETVSIDPKRMRVDEIAGMYLYDIERVKKYLLTEHNDGKLNIELLTIVGAEMGAIVAANWAKRDWSWPILPSLKQGQDVKALVLVSPKQAFKGLKLQRAYQHEAVRKLSTLILVGADDRRAHSEAKRLHTKLKRFHASGSRNTKSESLPRTLFLAEFPTSLQGTNLIDAPVSDNKLGPHQRIGAFIHDRVVSQQEIYAWEERGNPIGG